MCVTISATNRSFLVLQVVRFFLATVIGDECLFNSLDFVSQLGVVLIGNLKCLFELVYLVLQFFVRRLELIFMVLFLFLPLFFHLFLHEFAFFAELFAAAGQLAS